MEEDTERKKFCLRASDAIVSDKPSDKTAAAAAQQLDDGTFKVLPIKTRSWFSLATTTPLSKHISGKEEEEKVERRYVKSTLTAQA